ncbi:hypothetical protein JHV56_18635 [Arthrobacter sp. BHU FT2]|nr:hypothetical protein [Arthrobacter sp. BHU FT2]
MAEHGGGNRGNDRGAFRGNNNSGGDPRGFRGRGNRDNNERSFGGGDRKPFGDRPRRDGDQDRRSFGDRDRKPFGDRPRRDGDQDRRSFGGGDRKPFGDRDRKPFGDRPRRDGDQDRRSFGDRDRKPFGDRPRRDGDQDRRSFGDRDRKPFGDRDRKPFGDRPRRDGDQDRRSFGDGGNRRPFGDRQDRDSRSFDRGPARGGADRGPARGGADRGQGRGGFDRDRREERPKRTHNASDIRSANRPDRERSPEIDEDVTGKELDRATQHQIKTLESRSAEWVARHLVMAGRLIDEEPELAFQHALAASRRGGRLGAVREAVGLTAYAAGHYGEALREFRTYRRISGSNVHLPVMADCERGLGRPDRALDVARSEEAQDLDAPGKVELAIVAAGARTDLGQLDAAVAELEIPQLDMNRAFSYSPRLFRAYANALSAVGRNDEADKWNRQAVVAENALGQGVDEEPDIIDLGWDEEEEAREEAERRRLREHAQKASADAGSADSSASDTPASPDAGSADAVDENVDDQDSDYFTSDDAESDEDSVEEDEPGSAEDGDDQDDDDAAETGHPHRED